MSSENVEIYWNIYPVTGYPLPALARPCPPLPALARPFPPLPQKLGEGMGSSNRSWDWGVFLIVPGFPAWLFQPRLLTQGYIQCWLFNIAMEAMAHL